MEDKEEKSIKNSACEHDGVFALIADEKDKHPTIRMYNGGVNDLTYYVFNHGPGEIKLLEHNSPNPTNIKSGVGKPFPGSGGPIRMHLVDGERATGYYEITKGLTESGDFTLNQNEDEFDMFKGGQDSLFRIFNDGNVPIEVGDGRDVIPPHSSFDLKTRAKTTLYLGKIDPNSTEIRKTKGRYMLLDV